MSCDALLDKEHFPSMEEVVEFIGEDAKETWHDFMEFIEENYKASPKMAFSKCSAKPGWNVKFHKSGKSWKK